MIICWIYSYSPSSSIHLRQRFIYPCIRLASMHPSILEHHFPSLLLHMAQPPETICTSSSLIFGQWKVEAATNHFPHMCNGAKLRPLVIPIYMYSPPPAPHTYSLFHDNLHLLSFSVAILHWCLSAKALMPGRLGHMDGLIDFFDSRELNIVDTHTHTHHNCGLLLILFWSLYLHHQRYAHVTR